MNPLRDNIAVKPHDVPDQEGGIALVVGDQTDYDQHRTRMGDIIAMGPKVRGLEVGETVMFTNHEDMYTDGVMMICEADVLGVME